MVGLDARSTMDIDATVKGATVGIEEVENMIASIISVPVDDGVEFRVKRISEIMDEAEYPGIRVSMETEFDGVITPLKIDISTGDAITPREVRYSFKLLLGVSGVGPKAALAILSAATPESLAMAIVTGDEKRLTAAPGVGKKIAQRIILELKDKLAKEQGSFDAGSGAVAVLPVQNNKAGEAAAALAVLGYGSQELSAALKGIDMEALPLEEIILQSLKKMVK